MGVKPLSEVPVRIVTNDNNLPKAAALPYPKTASRCVSSYRLAKVACTMCTLLDVVQGRS